MSITIDPAGAGCIGLRGDFGSALAVYGLVRVLAQVEPESEMRARWVGVTIEYAGDAATLAERITREWRPSAVFSPWQNASGLVPGGGSSPTGAQRLQALAGVDIDNPGRLKVWRQGLEWARERVEHAEQREIIRRGKVADKPELVRMLTLDASKPAAALRPWMDACVVATLDGTLRTNPLTGSGGNAGRLEFATLYARCVYEVLAHPERSTRWLHDLLTGHEPDPEPLLTGVTPSMFLSEVLAAADPESGPAILNPWWLILAVEGMIALRPGPGRLGDMMRHLTPHPAWVTDPKPVSEIVPDHRATAVLPMWSIMWQPRQILQVLLTYQDIPAKQADPRDWPWIGFVRYDLGIRSKSNVAVHVGKVVGWPELAPYAYA